MAASRGWHGGWKEWCDDAWNSHAGVHVDGWRESWAEHGSAWNSGRNNEQGQRWDRRNAGTNLGAARHCWQGDARETRNINREGFGRGKDDSKRAVGRGGDREGGGCLAPGGGAGKGGARRRHRTDEVDHHAAEAGVNRFLEEHHQLKEADMLRDETLETAAIAVKVTGSSTGASGSATKPVAGGDNVQHRAIASVSKVSVASDGVMEVAAKGINALSRATTLSSNLAVGAEQGAVKALSSGESAAALALKPALQGCPERVATEEAAGSAAVAGVSAACLEEREVLEAVYGQDFTAVTESHWSIAIVDGVTLSVLIPEGYPLSVVAPKLTVEKTGRVHLSMSRLIADLQREWRPSPDQSCIFDWVQAVQQHLQCGMPPDVDTLADIAPGIAASAGEEAAGGQGTTVSVKLATGTAREVGSSFTEAGFRHCSAVSDALQIYVHSDKGVTVELLDELQITVDGIDAEDLEDWANMQLTADAGKFGARLLEWATAQRSAEPGFLDEDDEDGERTGLEFLPSSEELGVQRSRPLVIYTWGKALRKCAPPESQFNFNASILNGRGGGADLRTQNGTSEEVQRNVASCGLFPRWLEMVCNKVEKSMPPLHAISMNCTKGRHRSVAAAEILKKFYYPNATLHHVTIH